MTDMEYIRSRLTRAQLWGQLAEEAAELAQAALKMQRLEQGVNLPRKDGETCIAAVIEEHADVELLFEMLEWQDKEKREQIKAEKVKRWAKNLLEEENLTAETGRTTGHWMLIEQASYAEIRCSHCGNSPWKCSGLYPNHGDMAWRMLGVIREGQKVCRECGAQMTEETDVRG